MTLTFYINFRSCYRRKLKFGFDWPSGFREEALHNDGHDRLSVGSQRMHIHNGSGELDGGNFGFVFRL